MTKQIRIDKKTAERIKQIQRMAQLQGKKISKSKIIADLFKKRKIKCEIY